MTAALLWLGAGCSGEDKDDSAACAGADCGETGDDTGEPDHTGDSDSAPPDDSGPDDSGDSGGPDWCAETSVTFEGSDGSTQDLTDSLLAGTYTTLDAPGTLWVCPGTWFARLLVRANVEVVGLGDSPDQTVLSGGESGTILDVAGPDVTLGVSNLTLDRGAGLNVEHNSGGGGIYCAGYGAVNVDRVAFTNNFANDGAGLYTEDCTVVVTDSTFTDNLSEDDGGAVTLWWSDLTMQGVEFADNIGLDGGGMTMFYSTAALTDVTFRANSSTNYGGGLWLYNGTLGLTDVVFEDNVNASGDGGGLQAYGTVTMERTTFSGNSAGRGGGVFVYYDSVLNGTDCSFDGNTPQDIYAANYTEAGGESYTGGAGVDVACAANVCTVE